MTHRLVECTYRNVRGAITHLVGEWGVVSVEQAMRHTREGVARYYIMSFGDQVDLVVQGGGLQLRPGHPVRTSLKDLPQV